MHVPHESGAYLLSSVLFLIFLMGLSSVFGMQMTRTEQRMTSLQEASLQAEHAALTGLSEAIATLDITAFDSMLEGEQLSLGERSVSTIQGTPLGRYTTHAQLDNANTLTVYSHGTSDKAHARLSQSVLRKPLFRYLPPVAITSSAGVFISSLVEVTSDDTNTLIWSGRGVNQESLIAYSSSNDPRLMALEDEAFLENFLDLEGKHLASLVNTTDCQNTCDSNSLSSQTIQLVRGDINIDRNLGTYEHPCVLIVDGNLRLSKSALITGVVLVLGHWDNGSDSGNILGSLLVGGEMRASGVLSIRYDAEVIQKILSNAAYLFPLPGSRYDA